MKEKERNRSTILTFNDIIQRLYGDNNFSSTHKYSKLHICSCSGLLRFADLLFRVLTCIYIKTKKKMLKCLTTLCLA